MVYRGANLLQDPNDPRLRLVENKVINLVVPVHERHPVSRLLGPVGEVPDQLAHARQGPHGLARLGVAGGGLGLADGGPGLELAGVEVLGLAEGGEVDLGGGDGVEGCEGADCVLPPCGLLAILVLAFAALFWFIPCASVLYLGPRVISSRDENENEKGTGETHMAVLSSGVTPGILKSSKILPSINSMT